MYFFDSITNITADYIDIGIYLRCLAAAMGCGLITALAACVKSRAS